VVAGGGTGGRNCEAVRLKPRRNSAEHSLITGKPKIVAPPEIGQFPSAELHIRSINLLEGWREDTCGLHNSMPEHGADASSKSMSEPQESVKVALGLHADYCHVRDNNRYVDLTQTRLQKINSLKSLSVSLAGLAAKKCGTAPIIGTSPWMSMQIGRIKLSKTA